MLMQAATGWVDSFVTWQTPLSFLAGVGAHHLWCKYWRDRDDREANGGVQEKG